MWDGAKDIYEYVARNDIYVEDLDIQLHVYTFPMTSDLLAYCKENSYRIDISEGTILEFPHFDFTYTDIDSVEWVTNCTEETGFSVGTCAAAGFNFSIFSEKYLDDGSNVTYDTTEFKRAVVIPVYDFYHGDNLIVQKQLGVFHVSDYEKDTDKIDFTCLDNMQFFDKKATGIQKYISVPLKSNALFGQILKKLNLAEGPVPAEIKYFQVNQVEHLKKLTYRTIISYAMEAIGAYAYANSIGEISYKCFYASSDPVATILYEDIMEEKRKGNGVKINGYDIQYGDNAISAFSYAAGEEEVEVPVPLTVDNPLFIKKKQESLDTIGKRIFDRMYGFSFDPYEVTAFLPNFYIEAGDFVNIEDKYGEIHKILASQLTWRDNLEMEIVSAYETGDTDSDYDSDVNEAIQRNGNIDSIPSDDDSEEPTVATFSFSGKEFNAAIKTIYSGSKTSYNLANNEIDSISFSENQPADGDNSITFESEEGNKLIVFAPLNDRTNIKMYCDADMVKLSADMSYMFHRYKSITSLDLNRFDTSNVTTMCYMFSQCENLVSLNVSSFNTEKVTDMSYMFYSCYELESLDLSSFDANNVTNVYRMFYECTNITSIDLSNFGASNITSMCEMFSQCESLASLDLSSFNTEKVTDMSYVFECCYNLISIDLSSFDTSNVTTMAAMFYKCNSLTSLDLTNFNTSSVTTMGTMFCYCTLLVQVLVGAGWVTASDNGNMFTEAGCSDVTYV